MFTITDFDHFYFQILVSNGSIYIVESWRSANLKTGKDHYDTASSMYKMKQLNR